MSSTYPIELNLAGRPVVVIGGGQVAERKVAALIEAGARVRVISPSFTPGLERRADIELCQQKYQPGDLDGAVLVFACTDDIELNARVTAEARSGGQLCNVADNPDACDFFVPATLRRGGFTLAVGTGGASPQLAADVRDRLASNFGPEFGILTEELARARRIVQERVADSETRRRIFQTLCADCSLKLLAARGREAWQHWFERVLEHRMKGLDTEPDTT